MIVVILTDTLFCISNQSLESAANDFNFLIYSKFLLYKNSESLVNHFVKPYTIFQPKADYNIKRILSQLNPELAEKFFVNTIGLFGSIVRDDFTVSSDIDIIVDFSKPIGIEFIDIANYIESKPGKKVDLVSRNGIKPKYFH